MTKIDMSHEERALRLFTRLRELDFDHCPAVSGLISPAQMTLLEKVTANPGCGVQEIADRLNLSSPTVSVGVSKLEEGGLVERKPNPNDGRSVQFFPTTRGETLHMKFQDSRLKKFHRILAGLDSQEQETLLQLLEKALNYVEVVE
jgi:DNA-binding MarR family transcriptional regulator